MKSPSFILALMALMSVLLMSMAMPTPAEGVRSRNALKQFQIKRGQPGGATNRLRARASPSPSPKPSPSPSRKYVAPAIHTEGPRPTDPGILGVWS